MIIYLLSCDPLLGFGRVSAGLLETWLVVASEPPQGHPGLAAPFGRNAARFSFAHDGSARPARGDSAASRLSAIRRLSALAHFA